MTFVKYGTWENSKDFTTMNLMAIDFQLYLGNDITV